MIGLAFNRLENNKIKVEKTRVFEIVLQCSVLLNKQTTGLELIL